MSAPAASRHRQAAGFGLVELMIALLLGVLVSGAAITIFLSNSQTYRATETVSRIQENTRAAFELMARDLREAGSNPCSKELAPTNIFQGRDSAWWVTWTRGVKGYGGDAFALPDQTRLAGSDAIEVAASVPTGHWVDTRMASWNAGLSIQGRDAAAIPIGDVLMVCDYRFATIFAPSSASATQITHDDSTNCVDGFPTAYGCDTATAAWHLYEDNAVISRPVMFRWFVRDNQRGGTSLYRSTTAPSGDGAIEALSTDEIVEGVTGLSISYLVAGADEYRETASITGDTWASVTAARVVLDLLGPEQVGGEDVAHRLVHVITFRNHLE